MRARALALVPALLSLSAAAHADPAVWRIEADGGDLWLLGSVHYLRESDYPLPDVVDELYERADRLVMELDLDGPDAARMQTELVRAAMLPQDRSLATVLEADLYRLAEQRADELGFGLEGLARFEPWLVALTLMDLGMGELGYRAERGLEQYLLRRAARDGKPVSGLETIEAQIGVFETLSLEEQQAMLEQTLTELDEAESATAEMIAAWRDGRLDELGNELLREFERYPRLYRMLVVDRNESWIEPIVEHLERPGAELVIAGALHFVGPDSVVRMLEARGYTVERLR